MVSQPEPGDGPDVAAAQPSSLPEGQNRKADFQCPDSSLIPSSSLRPERSTVCVVSSALKAS